MTHPDAQRAFEEMRRQLNEALQRRSEKGMEIARKAQEAARKRFVEVWGK